MLLSDVRHWSLESDIPHLASTPARDQVSAFAKPVLGNIGSKS